MKRIKRVNEVFLMTVAIAVISSFLIGIISGIFGANEMVTLIISQLIFFMPSAFYLLENRFDLKETIRLHRIKVSTVVLLVVFMYLLMPAITFINAVSLKFTTNTIDTTVMEIANQYPFIIGILIVAVVPSILEECVYRGLFFNEYRKVNPQKAVVLSGLLFGLAHMNFNQFIYAFLLGMVFSIVVEATDSILSSMILHFVMNGTSMVTIYAQKYLEKMGVLNVKLDLEQTVQELDAYIQNGWLSGFIGVILGFFVLKLIAKNEGRSLELKAFLRKEKNPKKEVSENSKNDTKLSTLALWIGIVVCLGIMLLVEVTA